MALKKCITKGCTNDAVLRRRVCYKCFRKNWRERHPIRYLYANLKTNAKRRGKEFLLTFEEFHQFCIDTGYDKLKGTSACDLSVDRIDSSKGYFKENIRAITVSENSSKCNRDITDPDFIKSDDCPF